MTLPEKECQDELLSIFNGLPRHHKGTLERVVFHLARVAQKQEDNKMNPQNLAIIIAPCIIRAPDHIPPLTGKRCSKSRNNPTICLYSTVANRPFQLPSK
jgi:hypothetical protein